jgi:hypothetical protein
VIWGLRIRGVLDTYIEYSDDWQAANDDQCKLPSVIIRDIHSTNSSS